MVSPLFTRRGRWRTDRSSALVGTCYCPTSNFGNNYCEMEPKWYHTDGNGRAYKGDRHPEGYGDEYPDNMYESEARACNNCGKVTKVFKKECL